MNKSRTGFSIWFFSALALVLLALSVMALFYIRAQSQEASRLSDQADQAAQEEMMVQSIRTIQVKNKDDIDAFQKLIISDSGIVSLIDSIEKSGRGLGLSVAIASIDKSAGKKPTDPQTINIVVQSDGSWGGNYAFLKALESLPNRVSIDSANLYKESGSWHLKISFSLYSFN